MKLGIVIVAAGRGERAGSPEEGPKQYRPIGGKAVIEHTLSTFLGWDSTCPIVIVSHADDAALLSPILQRLEAGERIITVTGGATRQQSVLAGLEALPSEDLTHVMIHDAVRPFVAVDMLERIVALHAEGARGVLPALPVTDTLKRGADDRVVETVSRQGLYAAQTPQSFGFGDILAAHRAAAISGKTDFTDDASIA